MHARTHTCQPEFRFHFISAARNQTLENTKIKPSDNEPKVTNNQTINSKWKKRNVTPTWTLYWKVATSIVCFYSNSVPIFCTPILQKGQMPSCSSRNTAHVVHSARPHGIKKDPFLLSAQIPQSLLAVPVGSPLNDTRKWIKNRADLQISSKTHSKCESETNIQFLLLIMFTMLADLNLSWLMTSMKNIEFIYTQMGQHTYSLKLNQIHFSVSLCSRFSDFGHFNKWTQGSCT